MVGGAVCFFGVVGGRTSSPGSFAGGLALFFLFTDVLCAFCFPPGIMLLSGGWLDLGCCGGAVDNDSTAGWLYVTGDDGAMRKGGLLSRSFIGSRKSSRVAC